MWNVLIGVNCELNIRNCRDGLCMNNGTCVESTLFEGFLCQCQANFYGIFCEKDICSTDICEPGGMYWHINGHEYALLNLI